MARKILNQKKNAGREPPGNSMDLSYENLKNYTIRDNILLSCDAMGDWSLDNYYPSDPSVKKLINEQISRQSSTRRNTPSVVARLMGMDMFPSDTKLAVEPIVKKNGNLEFNLPMMEGAEKSMFGHVSISSKSTRSLDIQSLRHNGKQNDYGEGDPWLERPRSREHPQEEELQKFKKEFEAWKASKFRECSRNSENGNSPEYLIAQADFDTDKVTVYANSCRTNEHVEQEKDNKEPQLHGKNGFSQYQNDWEIARVRLPTSRRIDTGHDLIQAHIVSTNCDVDNSSGPTRIVILKPGPEMFAHDEYSRASSSSTMDGKGSIVDFLEEVKERLKSELQGKPLKRNTVVRGGGIETPFSEKTLYPKNIAQCIPIDTRENVNIDLGVSLRRSESTRSYKSDPQFHGPSSPEFISSDTRRFLTERLKNVLKKGTPSDDPVSFRGSSIPSALRGESGRLDQNAATLNNPHCWGLASDLQDLRSRNPAFRCGFDSDTLLNREQSPGNLIRSLSAPVSGSSFAKLLLEDRRIVTGVQIRRKQENVHNVVVDAHRQRKERFNLRQKVSSFRHSFTLRKKLFGNKLQSMKETNTVGHDFLNDIMSGPAVMMNFHDRYDNPTEVPPSPASVCSSINEEFWRPSSYASPISTPDMRSIDGDAVPQTFRDISSDLRDLQRELKQQASFEADDQYGSEELLTEEIVDIKDPLEAYVRELLVASGLYDGSADKHFISSDPRPINDDVFREVEGKLEKENSESNKGQTDKKVDHLALLDLLNEKLPSILMPTSTMSKLGRELIGYGTTLPSPHGKKLLSLVWEIIRPYVQPPNDTSHYSLDNMVSMDIHSVPWARNMDKEANFLKQELESWIIGDLVNEIVKDIRHCA